MRRLFPSIRSALAILVLLTGSHLGAPASAADLTKPLARFAEDSFSETATAVGEIAASGDDKAAAILDALGDARLFLDPATKAVLWKDARGKFFTASSGAETSGVAEASLQVVRVNNRLRGVIQGALGTLTLKSPVAAKRLEAAAALMKSRDVAQLPLLEAALAAETTPGVKTAFERARAVLVLAQPDSAKAARFDAIQVLSRAADRDALGVLQGARDGLTDADLRKAVDDGIASVKGRLDIIAQVQNVWYGLSLGSVLLLAAIGLAITFGVMGVINMAHGEMVMLGAYTTYVVQEAFRTSAPDYFGWSLPLAIPLAFLVAGLVGVAIERGICRHLYGRPLDTLLATFGVSLVLQQAVRTSFGPTNKEVGAPSYMSGAFDVLGLTITYGRLWIIVFTLVVFTALLLVMKATPLGLQMRAVTQNRRMAAAMGIRTPWIDAMTFGLGSGIAGIAGVALSQIDNVSPNLGQSYIIDSFMVVVFGGVGSLWGTLVSAFALGVANKFLEPVAGAVLAKIAILVLLIVFIQKRPRGLFAQKGRFVET